MPEYHFTGTAFMRGVDFYINADTLDEAKAKAARGEIDLAEVDAGEMANWTLDPATGKINC